MAYVQYRIPAFSGLHQGAAENTLHPGETPDACNMDTAGGNLSVAKGYVRHLEPALPVPAAAKRLFLFGRGEDARFVAATDSGVYVLGKNDAAWSALFAFTGAHADRTRFDCQNVRIGTTEYLLLASGTEQILKWDGASAAAVPFGSSEGLSDMPQTLIELYFGRLFAAGDPAHPSRLYWSCAPGDGRSVEDWGTVAASENVSGGHVEVGTDSDPITGLFALTNQLVIFKRGSLYRLLGDRPGNYRIYPLNAAMEQSVHTACVRCGDVLYVLTRDGMFCYDGQAVRRMPDADRAQAFLASADLTQASSAACRNKLYYAVRTGDGPLNDAILTYDLSSRSYMVRRGFSLADLAASDGVLYLLDGNGRVCRFDEGDDYDGVPVEAHWRTPETDLGSKSTEKQLRELYLRGSGGMCAVTARAGGAPVFYERLMPETTRDVLEVPLAGSGRAFSLTFQNAGGSRFTIDGGVELLADAQRRPL